MFIHFSVPIHSNSYKLVLTRSPSNTRYLTPYFQVGPDIKIQSSSSTVGGPGVLVWRRVSWELVSRLQDVQERTHGIIADHAFVINARRVPEREKPFENIVAHDRSDVAPQPQVKGVLPFVCSQYSKGVRGSLVPRRSVVPTTARRTSKVAPSPW